jgi:hypothetical protein
VRIGARLLRKSPGFFLTSTFTLALGIAATTAMFSVVNAVLLRLPFGHPNRLVRFTAFDPAHQVPLEVSFVEIEEWRRANRTFDDVAGTGSTNWSYVLGALVVVGLALGVPAFLLVGSAMRSLVFEVSPTDSFAVGGAVLLLASVGMVATYVPAWRASLVDPVETLRAE